MKSRCAGVAMLAAVVTAMPAQAADLAVRRAYLMRGLLELSPGMPTIAAALRRYGIIVTIGSWMQRSQFVAEAKAHPTATAIFIGHSMGAYEAVVAGNELHASGVKVRVVGIDPLCTHPPSVAPGVPAVNIWGNSCFGLPATIVGARNVNVSAYGISHIGMPADPRVQARIVAAAISN
jgi:hypothetical protein